MGERFAHTARLHAPAVINASMPTRAMGVRYECNCIDFAGRRFCRLARRPCQAHAFWADRFPRKQRMHFSLQFFSRISFRLALHTGACFASAWTELLCRFYRPASISPASAMARSAHGCVPQQPPRMRPPSAALRRARERNTPVRIFGTRCGRLRAWGTARCMPADTQNRPLRG